MAADAGVTEEQVAALAESASSPLFSEAERLAAARLAEEQHSLSVTDETIAALRAEIGDAATVEL